MRVERVSIMGRSGEISHNNQDREIIMKSIKSKRESIANTRNPFWKQALFGQHGRDACVFAALAGIAVALPGHVHAQNRAVATMMRMMQTNDMPMGMDEESMMEGMHVLSADPDDPASQMKTDLGRAILQADFSRTPASVLQARMSLAAKARDRLVKLPEVLKPEKEEQAILDLFILDLDILDSAKLDSAKLDSAKVDSTRSEPANVDAPKLAAASSTSFTNTPGTDIQAFLDAASDAGDGSHSDQSSLVDQVINTDATGEATAAATGAANNATDPDAGVGKSGSHIVLDTEVASGADANVTQGAADGAPNLAIAAKVMARAKAMKMIAKQVEDFRLLVVAGNWEGVSAWLKAEAGEDAVPIYSFMLMALQQSDSALVPDEVIALSDACPTELSDKHIAALGMLLQATQSRGADAGAVAALVRTGTKFFGGPNDAANRKRAASLFVAAGLPVEAQAYLPPLDVARAAQDAELLDIYIVYYKALSLDKQGPERQALIDNGWGLALEVLRLDKATSEQRAKAVDRAIEFLPDIDAESGNAWLRTSLVDSSDIGWRILNTAHQRASRQLAMRSTPELRFSELKLIKRVGQAIIAAGSSKTYRRGLDMLTLAIVSEAEFTRNGDDTSSRRNRGGEDQFQPIPAARLAESLPDAAWLASIDPGLSAKLESMVASTVVGSGDLEAALGMIRPIATSDPTRAGKLMDALLAAWPSFMGSTPGDTSNEEYSYNMSFRGGRYMPTFNPGFGGGGGIPLTRARQVRALASLSQTLTSLREMKLKPAPKAISDAFAASHSAAEVYRAEDVEAVFGPMGAIPEEARNSLAETMRQRLSSVWRNPQIQEEAKTKRTNAELMAEVTRGYALARSLAGDGFLSKTWEQTLMLADMTYDTSEFLFGQNVDMPTYLGLRQEAFARYADAAILYGRALAAGTTRPSSRIYAQWFNASLGASDVGTLTRQDDPNQLEVDRVVDAIKLLGTEQAAAHIALFATQAKASMSSMAAELKPKYARAAMRVIGTNPAGRDLAQRLAFYDDLTKEVTLGFTVDGGTQVSSVEPFGAHLAVWSTRAVARESGGFAKYLENEQYNYTTGQQVDYRDQLEKKIRAALVESFDVVSITFHKTGVKPMGFGRPGWEAFPLAYVLMKAKGPDVDRIPPIALDMDFSDGEGQIILPVSTPLTLVDAKAVTPPTPVIQELQIEQTLDDREASTGVVRLSIVAKGKGLIPSLETLIDTSTIQGLSIKNVEDGGLAITDLDATGATPVPLAERTWTLELASTNPRVAPSTFTFPTAKVKETKLALKRYADADITETTATTTLASIPTKGPAWWVYALGIGALAGVGAVVWRTTRKAVVDPATLGPVVAVPSNVTPVGAISLLRRIESKHSKGLGADERTDLVRAIADIEQRYFAQAQQAETANGELQTTVERWAAKATR